MRVVKSFFIAGYTRDSTDEQQFTGHYIQTTRGKRLLRVVNAHNKDVLDELSPPTLRVINDHLAAG